MKSHHRLDNEDCNIAHHWQCKQAPPTYPQQHFNLKQVFLALGRVFLSAINWQMDFPF